MSRNDELKMALDEMGHPEKMAEYIIETLEYNVPPIPVEKIAEALGITKIAREDTEGKFEGLLISDTSKDNGAIWINSQSSETRQRFTIGHELGHFVLNNHDARAQCTNGDLMSARSQEVQAKRETEANQFSATLLMPEKMFKKDMARLGKPELSHVLKLAKLYQVSMESAAMRYVKFCTEPCAIMFSHKGKFRYAPRSKGFPKINLEAGRRLPMHCAMLQSDPLPYQVSDWFGTSLYNWTGLNQYFGQDILQAQHYDYGNGYRLGMLLFEDEIDTTAFDHDPFE